MCTLRQNSSYTVSRIDLLGGAGVFKNINKTSLIKGILMCALVAIFSFSLSRIRIGNNCFTFIVPFVIFCFLISKYFGYLSYGVSFFCLGNINRWFYLSYIIVFVALFFFKNIVRKDNKKLGVILGVYGFFLVLLEGVVGEIVFGSYNYFLSFMLGVVSYWITRYFYSLYIDFFVESKGYFTPFCLTFILLIISFVFVGLNLQFSCIDISIIVAVLLLSISGKIGLESGALYAFFAVIMVKIAGVDMYNLGLIFCSGVVAFLLNKTSKFTFAFTYLLFVVFYVYYYDISYVYLFNYMIGIVVYLFIPNKILKDIASRCLGSENFYEKVKREEDIRKIKMANKIIEMEEIFSLVSSKLSVKGRMKKGQKELLVEEVCMFDNLLKEFASNVKCNFEGNDDENKIMKELYGCGIDVLSLKIKENIFREKVVGLCVRCARKEIDTIVVKVVNRVLRENVEIVCVRNNEMFGFYKVKMRIKEFVKFSYGIEQRAKDGEFCGDSYLVYENEDKKIFALSDGMGTGKVAKEKSKLALDLFRKFMDVGFDEKQTVNSINCILKEEYSKDSYATLDLFIYDKYFKKFSFFKNGACNSYLIGKDGLVSVNGDDLPIGIVDKINVNENNVDVDKVDYVVMVSDGVNENRLSMLEKIKLKEPQKIAKEILGIKETISDDQTVIVIKLDL